MVQVIKRGTKKKKEGEQYFDRFWAIYPRHTAKKAAQKAWMQLDPSSDLVEMIVRAISQQILRNREKITRREWVPEWPYPASWLRGERWTDEIVLVTAAPIDLAKARATLTPEAYRQLLEQVKNDG